MTLPQTGSTQPVIPSSGWSYIRFLFLKPAARLTAYFLAAAVCVYRIATFTPQPLDSANTLRPLLNSVFIAYLNLFDRPEAAHEEWMTICILALLAPPALALLNFAARRGICKCPLWMLTLV